MLQSARNGSIHLTTNIKFFFFFVNLQHSLAVRSCFSVLLLLCDELGLESSNANNFLFIHDAYYSSSFYIFYYYYCWVEKKINTNYCSFLLLWCSRSARRNITEWSEWVSEREAETFFFATLRGHRYIEAMHLVGIHSGLFSTSYSLYKHFITNIAMGEWFSPVHGRCEKKTREVHKKFLRVYLLIYLTPCIRPLKERKK